MPLALAAHRRLVTEQEFLALPESTDRVELLDGEVIVSPSPSFRHQQILLALVAALGQWASGRDVTIGLAPLDVHFAPNRILQPDAFVLLSKTDLDHEGPIDRVPEICIEVISKNRSYDRVTKRYVYAEAGVREYWLIEATGLVERRSGEALESVEEIVQVLRSPLLPGFELELKNLVFPNS